MAEAPDLDFSQPATQQGLLVAAQTDPAANWLIYREFRHSAEFSAQQRARYGYLQAALRGGQSDALFEAARLLRSGFLKLNASGELEAADQQPDQEALEQARAYLVQASEQGHVLAGKMLANLPGSAWDARTAQRSLYGIPLPQAAQLQTPSVATPAERRWRRNARITLTIIITLMLLERFFVLLSATCTFRGC